MAEVQTVRGPVDTAELGRTYMHEHVFVLNADVQQNYPQEWGDEDTRVRRRDPEADCAVGVRRVRTIVDPTVIGLGRYIPRIQRVAEQVPDLNIVVATGCYTYQDVPFFFHYRGPALEPFVGQPLPEPMVDMFAADITEGIAGTGVQAGMLKSAIDRQGMTSGVERVMRAVAKAHRQTGMPVTVHTHPGAQTGLAAHRVLDEEGVDPPVVVLGHSGDTTDVDHLQTTRRSRLRARHGPIRRQPRHDVRSPCRHRHRAVPAAGSPRAWCWPTMRRATSTGSSPACWRFCRNGTTCTSSRMCCRISVSTA